MKAYHQIRLLRTAIQIVTAAVLAVSTAVGVPCLLARMQIVTAIAASSVCWLLFWAAMTMIFGRVYCSTVCPTGFLLDIFGRLRGRRHYLWSRPRPAVRTAFLVLFAACFVAGVTSVVGLLDPYGAFTRIVTACVRPMAIGAGGLLVAVLTLAVIAVSGLRRGRLICNTVCPVGSLLGLISRRSLYHADINTDLCVNCGRCADVCKAECIDLTDHVVDASRCVTCFDCMDVCPNEAMTYRRGRHRLSMPMMQRVAGPGIAPVESELGAPSAQPRPIDRRRFIMTGTVVAATTFSLAADNLKNICGAGGRSLRPIKYVTPPGTASREDYLQRCTGCGVCAAACPSGVLRMSSGRLGLKHVLTPYMDFGNDYCRTDCVACTEVCPTGALSPLTRAEKRRFVIGKARIVIENCILYTDATPCGVCQRSCPFKTIVIKKTDDGRQAPDVVMADCTGCGMCESHCPSQAIIIEGTE